MALLALAVATRRWWLLVALVVLYLLLFARRGVARRGAAPAATGPSAPAGVVDGRLIDQPPSEAGTRVQQPDVAAPSGPPGGPGGFDPADLGKLDTDADLAAADEHTLTRLPPGEEAVRGVEVVGWPDGSHQVGLWALELVGDLEVDTALRRHARRRLAAVPGVLEVVDEGGESYRVTGTAQGHALLAAAAEAVDEMADQIIRTLTQQ